MKPYFIFIPSRCLRRYTRPFSSFITLVAVLCLLGGCSWDDPSGANKSIENMINEIDKTMHTAQWESSAWRDELPKLVSDLSGIESQASGDVKEIAADTTNQIQDLATQSIQFGDAKAQDLIAQAGSEFRCNAGFVKVGVAAQLQYIMNELTFWKQNRKHLGQKPTHAVCWINPSALALYPSQNNWLIDTSNMSEKNIVRVFGYNFQSDALPALELRDANNVKLRDVNVQAAYVTHYQINLDFSNEKFPDVESGARIEFRWPDQPDPNTINLTLNIPAKLEISNPVFTPAAPIVQKDAVTLQVVIANQGGLRSENAVVTWKPDPNDGKVFPVTLSPLEPGQSRSLSFPAYVYHREGSIPSQVSISNGDSALSYSLTVQPTSTRYSLGDPLPETNCCGGSGGNGPEILSCNDTSVVDGLQGAAHTNVDRLGLLCADLLPNGSLGTQSETEMRGGGGSDPFSVRCPGNQLLIGVYGRTSNILEQMGGLCASIEDITAGRLDRVVPIGHWGSEDNGGPFSTSCQAGTAVKAISVKWGDRVDHLSLICAAVIVQN